MTRIGRRLAVLATTGTLAVLPTVSAFSAASAGTPAAIAGGSSVEVSVAFAPLSPGSFAEVLELTDETGRARSPSSFRWLQCATS